VSNRWLRFVIALFALAAAGAAGFRVFQHERDRDRVITVIRTADAAAESALASVGEIKAALHAYVASGQGDAFWSARAATLLDSLRGAIVELDREAARVGGTATETLDVVDRLAAAERRAVNYVRAEQRLMAAEVIFSESGDLLASLRDQIASARTQVASAADAELRQLRQEQALMAGGAGVILSLAVLLLAATGRAVEPAPVSLSVAPTTLDPVPVVATPEPPAVQEAAPVFAAPTPSEEPLAPTSVARLGDAAALCLDLARAATSADVSALLSRASSVLNASGIIVWMLSADRRELMPAGSAGYDERLFSRIPSIPTNSSNLTAAAFRAGAARTSAATGNAAAALAVPLVGPGGAIGVFSAELRRVDDVDAPQLSLATIFAAQLSTLVAAMAPAAGDERPVQQQAQA
jgi:hypothetical protein